MTERTFFRHFADKRDILFEDQDALQAAMSDAIALAPADCSPMQVLLIGFRAVESIFEDNRAFSGPRQHVIAATPALREREAGKTALMMAAMSQALERRGVDTRSSKLAVQVGAAVFNDALNAWIADNATTLDEHLERAFGRLRAFAIIPDDPPRQ